ERSAAGRRSRMAIVADPESGWGEADAFGGGASGGERATGAGGGESSRRHARDEGAGDHRGASRWKRGSDNRARMGGRDPLIANSRLRQQLFAAAMGQTGFSA